jgi:hypothetical protein
LQVGPSGTSTILHYRRRGQRPVVTIEPLDQDRQQVVDTIAKLDRRVGIPAAVVRVLLAMLRASGFTLAGERLPEGAAKAGILRLAANRAMTCDQCRGQQASLSESPNPP